MDATRVSLVLDDPPHPVSGGQIPGNWKAGAIVRSRFGDRGKVISQKKEKYEIAWDSGARESLSWPEILLCEIKVDNLFSTGDLVVWEEKHFVVEGVWGCLLYLARPTPDGVRRAIAPAPQCQKAKSCTAIAVAKKPQYTPSKSMGATVIAKIWIGIEGPRSMEALRQDSDRLFRKWKAYLGNNWREAFEERDLRDGWNQAVTNSIEEMKVEVGLHGVRLGDRVLGEELRGQVVEMCDFTQKILVQWENGTTQRLCPQDYPTPIQRTHFCDRIYCDVARGTLRAWVLLPSEAALSLREVEKILEARSLTPCTTERSGQLYEICWGEKPKRNSTKEKRLASLSAFLNKA